MCAQQTWVAGHREREQGEAITFGTFRIYTIAEIAMNLVLTSLSRLFSIRVFNRCRCLWRVLRDRLRS